MLLDLCLREASSDFFFEEFNFFVNLYFSSFTLEDLLLHFEEVVFSSERLFWGKEER
jgi:hypothetical protein